MPPSGTATQDPTRWLPFDDLDRLLDALRADGRTIVGPVVRDEAIVLDEIATAADLPAGRGAETGPGRYRLTQRDDAKRFDHAVGPMSPKRWTFPPREPIRIGKRTASGVRFTGTEVHPAPLALIGVRACELAALGIQDHVLLDGQAIDGDYRARRAATFVVAVECATPTSTCFCTSMGTGPEVSAGFDVALTELDDGFVVRTGSPAGATLIDSLDLPVADPSALDAAAEVVAGARRAMGTPLDMSNAHAGLAAAPEHPGWAAVAERCLGCTNCTLVCPTCFCTSVVQRSDLDGDDLDRGADLGLLLHRRLREGRRRLLPAARQGPLSPVADPQVLDLVGPVRVERLRRLRPVHRLVPGRHRRPRGAGGHRRHRPGPDAAAHDDRDGRLGHAGRAERTGRDRPGPRARARWLRDGPRGRHDPRDRGHRHPPPADDRPAAPRPASPASS